MLLEVLALLSSTPVAIAAEVPAAPADMPAALRTQDSFARAWSTKNTSYEPAAVAWYLWLAQHDGDAKVRGNAFRRLTDWADEGNFDPEALRPLMVHLSTNGAYTVSEVAKRWLLTHPYRAPAVTTESAANQPALAVPATTEPATTGPGDTAPAVPAPAPAAPALRPAPFPAPPPLATRTSTVASGPTRPESKINGGTIALGIGYGGYVGGLTGYLIGESIEGSTETDASLQGIAPGVLLGASAGGVVGGLVGMQRDPDPDKIVQIGSFTALGGYFGHNLGGALIPLEADGGTERIFASQLGGTMIGAGVGMALKEAPSPGQSLHLDLATAIGWQAGAGISDMAGLTLADQYQGRAAISMGTGAAFLGVAAVANKSLEAPQPLTLGLATMDAMWLGGWAPFLFTDAPTNQQRAGAIRLGLGVGYATTVVLCTTEQPSPKSAALQAVGFAAGNALGAGIPLATGGDGRAVAVVGPMLVSGLAGQVVGAVVAPHYDVSVNDRFLMSTLGVWTGYQVGGWAAFASAYDEGDSQVAVGYALTAGGAGTLTAMALAPALEVSPAGSVELLALGGWGTWFGGWTAEATGMSVEDQWLTTLVTGDAALIAGAVAQGAGWEPDWRDVGVANGVGVVGAAAGGLVGVIGLYDEDDWTPMIASTMVGSAAGLGVGHVLAARSDKSSSAGLLLPAGRGGRALAADASVRPWTDEDGDQGLWLAVNVNEVRR